MHEVIDASMGEECAEEGVSRRSYFCFRFHCCSVEYTNVLCVEETACDNSSAHYKIKRLFQKQG